MTGSSRPALFLDRDGVVNVNHGYVHKAEDTDFIDGIFELVKCANHLGYAVVVATNQAGIGRGYYSEEVFEGYMAWMRGVFLKRGANIDAVYFCPHHPEHGIGRYKRDCFCRKPNPGMILQAAEDLSLSLSQSVFVGDSESDMIAAHRAGIPNRFMLTPDRDPIPTATKFFDRHRSIETELSKLPLT